MSEAKDLTPRSSPLHIMGKRSSADGLAHERAYIEPSVASLATAVIKGDISGQELRSLPSQTVYFVFQALGLESSGDLLSEIRDSQYTAILDFDLWDKDSPREEQCWDWFAVAEQDPTFGALGKLVRCLDPDLLASILSRHFEAWILDDALDQPPAPYVYTPDRGYTWVEIKTKDATKHRLVGKVLAYIYQTKPDFFYRMIALQQQQTVSELEEEALENRQVRLRHQEIPTHGESTLFHQRLPHEKLREALTRCSTADIQSSERGHLIPIFGWRNTPEPLASLVRELLTSSPAKEQEDFQLALGWVTNNALVFFSTPIFEPERVALVVNFIKGALNIGLELALNFGTGNARSIYEKIGLTGIYQAAWSELALLRKDSTKLHRALLETAPDRQEDIVILEQLCCLPPSVPDFFLNRTSSQKKRQEEKIDVEPTAIRSLAELTAVRDYLLALERVAYQHK